MIEPSDIERGELPETSAAYITDLEQENEALHKEVLRFELENKRLNGLYCELLHQVEMKYSDESRHETAKRMLRTAQQSMGPAASVNDKSQILSKVK
jgi:hypothetical protein